MTCTWRFILASPNLFSLLTKKGPSHRYCSKMVNVEINESRKKARCSQPVIGTHSGTFHCDEVLACFMLKQLPEYENATIFRSRDDKELQEKCDIIVDVGGTFDHDRKLYDHHQKSFQETLSTLHPAIGEDFKIRLSSAGLVYNFYGEKIISSILKRHKEIELSAANLKLAFVAIYKHFICEIDAIDNGVPICKSGEPQYTISTNLSERIGRLNPSWDEENIDIEERFEKAMSAAGQEFTSKVIEIGGSWINAREIVREAIENAKKIYPSGEILLLKKFCPWKAHLCGLEKEYEIEGIPKIVIFSENPTSWRVAGVPVTPDSFLGRKFLPNAWRGLKGDELCAISGIRNLIFVHHTGFIGGATTKEAAIAMAIKSVEMVEDS